MSLIVEFPKTPRRIIRRPVEYTVPAAAQSLDPAFAAIATHYAALVTAMRASRETVDAESSVCAVQLEGAETAARRAECKAECALCNVTPTSVAGALALLEYVDDLYAGKIALPEDPIGWRCDGKSGWISDFKGDEINAFSDEPIELPLIFWVARNARKALQSLSTVQL